MRHKVSKLEGALLDAAVAKAEGWSPAFSLEVATATPKAESDGLVLYESEGVYRVLGELDFSADWALGGEIIERERIGLACVGESPLHWQAYVRGTERFVYGDAPLIAAMRAYCANKFGDEVELP